MALKMVEMVPFHLHHHPFFLNHSPPWQQHRYLIMARAASKTMARKTRDVRTSMTLLSRKPVSNRSRPLRRFGAPGCCGLFSHCESTRSSTLSTRLRISNQALCSQRRRCHPSARPVVPHPLCNLSFCAAQPPSNNRCRVVHHRRRLPAHDCQSH